MAKRGTLEHPKTLQLADNLGIMDCFALGILEAFWEFIGKYHPTGDVTTLKPSTMARSIRYTGDSEQLWQALKDAGFLAEKDGKCVVHDWSEHCEDTIHTKLYRSVELFADGTMPKPRRISGTEKDILDKQWTELGHISDVRRTADGQTTDSLPRPIPIPLPCSSSSPEPKTTPSPKGEKRTWRDVEKDLEELLPNHPKELLGNWCEFKRQRKDKAWTETGTKAFASEYGAWTIERLSAAMRNSMANNYQGLVEPKAQGYTQPKPQNTTATLSGPNNPPTVAR